MDQEDPQITAAACRYLLIALLPRLERASPGLIAELRAGIAEDRDAIAAKGNLAAEVHATISESLRMLCLVGAA